MKLLGMKELHAQLKSLAVETQPKVLRASVRAAFKPVLEAAKSKVPVDTGELRAGIVLATAKQDQTVAAGLVVANTQAHAQARVAAAAFGEAQVKGSPARRWHLTELGTRTQAAQPFMRPAIDENAGVVVDGLKRELAKRIAKALKKGGK